VSSEPLSLISWNRSPLSGSGGQGTSRLGSWVLKASTPPGFSRPKSTRSQARNLSSGRWVKSEVTRMASKVSLRSRSSGRTVEITPCTPKRSSWKRTPSA
jgi:hypothetical protein